MTNTRFSDYLLVGQLAPKMLDQALVGILVVDEEGVIRYANELAEDLAGHPLTGETVDELVPPSIRAGHAALCSTFTSGNRLPVRWMGEDRHLNLRLVNSTGTEVPVSIGLRRVMTDQGRFVFAYITRRATTSEA